VHDIGLRMHRNGAGETGRGDRGGGSGTPFIGKTIKPFLPKRDLLSYVEAILRTYNQYGRRDNICQARIKILVHELARKNRARQKKNGSRSGWGACARSAVVRDRHAVRYRTMNRWTRIRPNCGKPARRQALPPLAGQLGRQPQASGHAIVTFPQAEESRRATPRRGRWTPSSIRIATAWRDPSVTSRTRAARRPARSSRVAALDEIGLAAQRQ
jgi:hypothetical protein